MGWVLTLNTLGFDFGGVWYNIRFRGWGCGCGVAFVVVVWGFCWF